MFKVILSTVATSPAQRLTAKPSSSLVKNHGSFNDLLFSCFLHFTYCQQRTRRNDENSKKKLYPKRLCVYFCRLHTTHVYGSRCYNLFDYQICKSLFVLFLPFDVQPQVIFPFEHCAIDAQHVVTAWHELTSLNHTHFINEIS